ncbi:amino acid ABC transporter substrate-binding protein [Idiomarina seosinensis]|uniref:Amino acid ABC transporter substrate-binding protein n=1 Tax=Idiomarina seosinensis TaxID=281739 RepID=A0A432ZDC1_9GAMM|nr:amino acid ABC transporter substrate-binding protein [Idiomarina seosinensis]
MEQTAANEVSLKACTASRLRYDGDNLIVYANSVKRLIVLLLISTFFFANTASARKSVYVAAYDFPPFFSDRLETDVTRELIKLLNNYQTTYEFILQAIPPNGRYEALSESGCCDVMFFESTFWGWQNRDVKVSSTVPLLQGRERLVALQDGKKDQGYFDNLEGKVLGGVKGYHYLMAGEQMNSAEVAERYRVYLSDSRITNLRMLVGGRIDAAVVNDELLAALKNSSVDYLDKLLISDRIEQQYKVAIVVGENEKISVETMQQLMREVARQGLLDRLFARFNLQRFQLYRR